MRAVIGRTGLPVPTQPLARPAHWPARPPRAEWTSPIQPAPDQSAARAAERAAADAAARAELAAVKAARTAREAAEAEVRRRRPDLPVEAIVAAYAKGRGMREIADDYGVSRRVIGARLKAAGVTLRPPGGKAKIELAEHGDYIRAAWTDPQVSTQQIADRLGIHRDTVRAIARTLALGPRPRPGTRRPRA